MPPARVVRHVVAPGDHLSKVAAVNGFRSFVPLADDVENKQLLDTRKTPHILADGDPVHIPPLDTREVDRSTEQRHRFKANIPELLVRLSHTTWAGAPIVPPPNVLIDGKTVDVKATGPDTFVVPIAALSDRLRFGEEDREIRTRIGFLQSISTLAGVRERLTNLGYEAGEKDDATDYQLRSAIEEFQCDQKLRVDGKIGQDTRARLVKVHGC
jgi:hypothetical protein